MFGILKFNVFSLTIPFIFSTFIILTFDGEVGLIWGAVASSTSFIAFDDIDEVCWFSKCINTDGVIGSIDCGIDFTGGDDDIKLNGPVIIGSTKGLNISPL